MGCFQPANLAVLNKISRAQKLKILGQGHIIVSKSTSRDSQGHKSGQIGIN